MTTQADPKKAFTLTEGKDPRATPAMRQFYRFKERHPDCVLLFRMGDFYELFDDDAVAVAKAINITLTERTKGVPMAGVPFHAAESYIKKMLDRGFRVAVCDQIQDPREAKGVVDRAVTRVLTPGALVDESLLPEDADNRIAALARTGGDAQIALAELSTGAFTLVTVPLERLADELARRAVSEALLPETPDGSVDEALAGAARRAGASPTQRPDWQYRPEEAREALRAHYGVQALTGLDLDEDDGAIEPAGALLRYLRETQAPREDGPTLRHLDRPRRERDGGAMALDGVSLRALEIERTIRSGATDGSLLGALLETGGARTAMGRRLLREWLKAPLARRDAIEARQACVATLVEDERFASELEDAIDGVQDVARIAGRLGVGRATPRDVAALGASLARLETLIDALDGAPAFDDRRAELAALRDALTPLATEIVETCVERPPTHLREGGLYRDGVDEQLDEARSLQRDASSWLADYQAKLIARHDLPSLKVGFNKVFGYYIELPRAQSRRAPDAFSRKQTLKNAERYITPELKAFEDKVTSAEARAVAREQAMFDGLCARLASVTRSVADFGARVAALDALLCFARCAARRGWTRPEIVDEPILTIEQGRHPVLERTLESEFVPNDCALGTRDAPARLAVITGPNMAGKSTYIRQAALLTLLAHTGSFVPAAGARIGLTDRVFTRVGADDALHAGQSTFMVEMTETASILAAATDRSLVILDEIGRGTSTLDGLSLAWAIAERLAGEGAGDESAPTPRTLFATHYHELTALEESMPGRVRNLYVAVREWGEEVVFLHRILEGRADRSYGVHVARLAGVPEPVIRRAKELLESLSVSHAGATPAQPAGGRDAPEPQMPLFAVARDHPALKRLREADLERLSPLEAFDLLRGLRDEARDR